MSNRALLQITLREHLPSFIGKCFHTLEGGRPFQQNWHIDHIAHELHRVQRGDERRLIINIPPRHLKSICVTVAYTAWALGRDPSLKIMTISYAQELTRQHTQAFNTIVTSPWYQELFPAFRIKSLRTVEVVTTEHGYRTAKSIGGSILGRGADLIIIDDPINGLAVHSEYERQKIKDIYDNVIYTRLNDKKRGAIVLVMQRLHQDDLVGHVLQKEVWRHTVIPAIAEQDQTYRTGFGSDQLYHRAAHSLIQESREGEAELVMLRRTLGSLSFAAQYQQNPVPPDGNIIRRDWLRYYDTAPECEFVLASWDTASGTEETADYSVGTVWGFRNHEFYLLDVIRGRFEFPDLRRQVIASAERYKPHSIIIEQAAVGMPLVQDLRRTTPLRPRLDRPLFDKGTRLRAQAPKFEAGAVLLPREAPWLATYISELLAFPSGRHDDQVDSTSQALNALSGWTTMIGPRTRPSPKRPKGAPLRRA